MPATLDEAARGMNRSDAKRVAPQYPPETSPKTPSRKEYIIAIRRMEAGFRPYETLSMAGDIGETTLGVGDPNCSVCSAVVIDSAFFIQQRRAIATSFYNRLHVAVSILPKWAEYFRGTNIYPGYDPPSVLSAPA